MVSCGHKGGMIVKRQRSLFPRSIFMRFALAFILVGLLPLMFFTGVTLTRFSYVMEENALNSTQQMVSLVADNLNARFQDVAHQTTMMYIYNSASYGTLRDILGQTGDYGAYFGMRDFTKNMLDANSSLRSVFFWDSISNKQYAASVAQAQRLRSDYDWSSLAYVQAALSNPRSLIVSAPHVEDYYLHSSTQVVTFCRAYLDTAKLPMSEKVLGIFMLDIPYAYLDAALSSYDWSANGELHIVDSNGTSLYTNNPARLGEHEPLGVQAQATSSDGAGDLWTSGDSRVIIRPISVANWQVQYKLDMRAMMRQITALQTFASWMIAVSAIGAAMLSILCSRSLSTPIKRLLSQMKRVRRGDMTAKVEPVGYGELGELGEGFNRMVTELQTYIDRSYLARIRQTEAELNELKAQIHPHFLYNTLEVIRMTALSAEDKTSAEMVEALAKQLKYVIGEMRDRVPLARELEMTYNYIALISNRYGDIQMDVKIPTSFYHCEVLKLCLQPVVENAVLHGLRPRGGGRISLTAQREDGDLLLTVMDDGVGMREEQINEVRERLQSEHIGERTEDGWRSIGLKNVHDRLRLTCGERYGLAVQSMDQVGTAVIIRLPYREEAPTDEAAVC